MLNKSQTKLATAPVGTKATSNVTAKHSKLEGYEFYHKILGSPKYVVAPMVDQSELAWRMLCRKYKADLCYSPMFHSNLFAKDPKYRKDALQTCSEDRPLIIQFCGNDAETILEAALLAQNYCEAIDINLGCPQAIAKRGHYGAFLQDDWNLLNEIVKTLHSNLKVPVTCKIRIFEDRDKTIRYAQMLEKAGCQLLTVHGRTREQKGPLTGAADWSYIREIRENIKIPMFANGNIMDLRDVQRCLDETGVDGIMTAEGNLHNPALFTGQTAKTWYMATEYLDYAQRYPCPISYIRGHLFKIFHHIHNTPTDSYVKVHANILLIKYSLPHLIDLLSLRPNANLREELAVANGLEKFRRVVQKVQQKYEPYHEGLKPYGKEEIDPSVLIEEHEYNMCLPPWLCQPYVRLSPEIHKQIVSEKARLAEDPSRDKRQYYDNEGKEISRKRMKKLRRRFRRPDKPEGKHDRHLENCRHCCCNPLGFKCVFRLCRICCRDRCYSENFDCLGHGILIKSRRAKAKLYEDTPRKDSDLTEEEKPEDGLAHCKRTNQDELRDALELISQS
uniref:tRNA-dihydrouridine(16/17) synthase [NAD(P)(+)]-like n=1 Tax=Glossina austeni TaxID=7395 RepID=A0A1A9VLN0_GLOAU